MAKVKFSALISDMRNKLNGSVFSKNRGGNYLRNKVTPVNPQTTFQAGFRASFGGLSSSFRGLNPDGIKGWNDAAASFPYVDIFGDTKYLSGIQLYVKLNQNLATAERSAITAAPTPAPVKFVSADALAATASPASMGVDYETVGIGGACTVIIEATRGVSAGRNFLQNEYRVIATAPDTIPITPTNLLLAYVARFGTLKAGQRIGIRLKCVENTTGQASPASSITAIVG